MESNQNFGELSWYTDFGLVGLKSGHTKKHRRGICSVVFL